MSCTILTDAEKELLKYLPEETEETLKGLVGLWMENNPNRKTDHPTLKDIQDTIVQYRGNDIDKTLAPTSNSYTVTYTPKGKSRQTYTIRGSKIYNKHGKEVFKESSADRLKIYANLAIHLNRAVVVEHKGSIYVVNNRNQILSGTTGKIMQWGEENGNRRAILEEARRKFAAKAAQVSKASTSTTFSTSSSTSYPERTRENVNWSDITIALAEDFNTAGERLTRSVSGFKYVSYTLTDSANAQAIADDIYNQMVAKGRTKDLKLNIAGNGIYTLTKPQEYYNDLLTKVISILQSKGVTISAIRSGGQTGIDEAGIIAAQRLNIPSIVHSTSDFKYRSKSGIDISSESGFKSRFQQQANIEEAVPIEDESNYTPIDIDANTAPEMLDDALMPPAPIYNTTEEEELDTSPVDTLPVATLEQQREVDLVFDPQTRRDRVSLISRFFSNQVDKALREAKDIINNRMKYEVLTEEQLNDLRRGLYALNRLKIIGELTPAGVFDRVKAIFEDYVNDTEEGRIQAELKKINNTKGAEKYSEEKKLAAAKKRAEYKYQEYQKIINNFEALAEEASSELLITEGIRVDPNYVSPDEANLNSDDPEGYSETDSQTDNFNKEDSQKDGWMTHFREVSAYESLSQAVRKVIRETPRLDYRGKAEKDDLGNLRYLDANYVHATLIDKLRYMITSEDMMPLLEDLAKLKPWVKQIIKTISKDDSLFSQFYQDFRKDFVQYWIQKKKLNSDGTYSIETISINKPEGVNYLLDAWRDNYESGTQLDEDSIYEKNGEINRDNAREGLRITRELNNQFTRLNTTQERLDLLNQEETWDKLMKLLHMIGIDPNPAVLRIALTNIKEVPGITFTDPIMLLLPQLNIIFSGVAEGKVVSKTDADGAVKRGDLINTFGNAYKDIAAMIAEVTEDAIESSVRENGKTQYSHVMPSYLGKLVKQLKNVRGKSEEDYDKFIEEEFKQYDWFYDKKNERWRSDWIEKLATDPKMRDALQHKVVLNYDKIAYKDWDDINYTLVLLNEYWAESKSGMAWYHVPILSDAPSAEFIRFVRYTTGSEYYEDGALKGKPKSYQDIILDKMIDIVNQEYDRIQLVKERHTMYLNGLNISPIANFDIIGDRKGGSEFKFIPELNDIRYEGGETFLDRFEKMRKGDSAKFREFIKNTLRDIMEDGFEATYADWHDAGLFEELPNGKFKNLPSNKFSVGQSKENLKVAGALAKAQKILGSSFTSEMEDLLNRYTNNKPVDDRQANRMFEQIKALLNNKAARNEIKPSERDTISRDLVVKNNSKEALREYYYNSKFATSQIIEMTTTDLAFYKDLEDFQKRFKEVHAPSLRLNTMAKFHGENIGRTWERTIYLRDDVIVSSAIDDIKEVLDAKVAKGEITKPERDYIISQFKDVNVADAQAYRSISSYRAMMGMMGQWTDEMETAYKHLTDPNGQWTLQDFNIIWQTKKPYVYTQVNNESGIEGHSGIKTPVQHKNSEFLLLALHSAISGPLGKSSKLRAINEFMEKRGIDVVQFESTTKVGKV